MAEQRIGIIMNGVTGRMGKNQHLIRSIKAIMDEGGLPLPNEDRLMPDPILVGRNAKKMEALSKETGIERWSTDLDECLENDDDSLYFDSVLTQYRAENIKKAIAKGKHIYTEKPISETVEDALELARLAKNAGVKNGAVHDKLYLQGLQKLKRLVDGGFFGRILSVRGEFGYWVFEGDWQVAQRPSWNYRKKDGGGIIVDMLCHWRYVLDNTFAPVKSVNCLGATHIPQRWDENNEAYDATSDDAAYAMFELEGGIIAQINSSWCTRVYRDELVSFQVDGTEGSAVAGLRECKIQHRSMTPKPVWNPDIPSPIDFYTDWKDVPDNQNFDNGFKTQWEEFLRHVVLDTPYKYDLFEGAKGVQLAERGLKSWEERRWLDVPELKL